MARVGTHSQQGALQRVDKFVFLTILFTLLTEWTPRLLDFAPNAGHFLFFTPLKTFVVSFLYFPRTRPSNKKLRGLIGRVFPIRWNLNHISLELFRGDVN